MILDLPIHDISSLGNVDNINMLQLNSTFQKLYMNDEFYKNIIELRPTVFELGKTYHKNDAIWLNTEWWKEFISFQPHIEKCATSLNFNNLSIQLGNNENISTYVSVDVNFTNLTAVFHGTHNTGTMCEYEINFNHLNDIDEELMKKFIRCSYLIGDLSNHTELYYFKSEFTPQISSFNPNNEDDYSAIVTSGAELNNYIRYNGQMNMTYISALVRSMLSAHANVVVSSYVKIGMNQILSASFNGQPISSLDKGYQLSYDKPYSTMISGLLSIDLSTYAIGSKVDENARQQISSAYAHITPSEISEYHIGVAQHDKVAGEDEYLQSNYMFDHQNISESERTNLSSYVDISSFNVNLSTMLSCKDSSATYSDITVRPNLNNKFKYVLATFPVQVANNNESVKMEVWNDGTIEEYGYVLSSSSISSLINEPKLNSLNTPLPHVNSVYSFITSEVSSSTDNNKYVNFVMNGKDDISDVISILYAISIADNGYKIQAVEDFVNQYKLNQQT